MEAVPDVVAVVDRDHRYLFANRAFSDESGQPVEWLLGKRNDEVVPAHATAVWREAIDHVLSTGDERSIERSIDTPRGARRYAARLVRLSGDLVCITTRDVTELRAERLLETATNMMPIGMCVAEAPSGRIIFRNDETFQIFGAMGMVERVADYAVVRGWDEHGRAMAPDGWPVARALQGETVLGETYRILRDDGNYRTVRISASPVRDAHGAVSAAVATYADITQERRAHDVAAFFAEVGAMLEALDDTSDLHALAELAVPRLADCAYVHLKVGDAIASQVAGDGDPLALVTPRNPRSPPGLVATDAATDAEIDAALARVLAGGPAELVLGDDAAAYRSSVVAAISARGRVLGAITLVITSSPRRFDDAALGVVSELARRVAVALDHGRLFRAEREARELAEQASERTRRLQELTSQLSGLLEEADVVSHIVVAGRGAIGAAAGFAWLLRDGQTLELVAHADASGITHLASYARIPLAAALPVCEVIRTGQPLLFDTLDAMLAAFPGALSRDATPYHAWAVIPFVANGRAIGAASFSFARERAFSLEDRQLLAAMIGQASLALERGRLLADIRSARRRERDLSALAAKLSSALTADEIAHVVAAEVSRALGAHVGSVMLRDGDHGARLVRSGPLVDARPDRLPLATSTPSTDAIRTGELVWCATADEIRARYLALEELRVANGLDAWGAVPFVFEGRVTGALAVAFSAPHALEADEREFLKDAGQLAGQAFERARLYDELRRTDERLRAALLAGRAGTWTVDLRAMTSHRDPSFGALLGAGTDAQVPADFASVHPDDREIARVALARAVEDGVPYEPEVRIQKANGTYLWTRSYGQVVRDAQGAVLLAGVTFDVDQAKRASLEIERAYAVASEANRRKDEFLAMLGHELRNPLAPIRTALDLMEFKASGVLQNERDVIARQVDHLSRLVDDLLDVSRITRGKVQLNRSVVELGGVLTKAIEMASPLLEKQSHRLIIDVPRAGLLVEADPIRLAQVFQNLIANAAKYTKTHGEIEVRASADDHNIYVAVRDNGIGIAPDLLAHLFELFTQGERSIDRAEGGLGIGLAIARSLCELHGGSIAAESPGADQGSTFTVRLPRARASLATTAPASASPHPHRPARAARVLIVDDNVDAAQMMHEYLAHLGYDAALAHDGMSGLELAGKLAPDVAVLDIGLPVMDGYELAIRLRAQFGGKLRLIAVTGYGQDADRARAQAAGFDHHLVKPIVPDALIALLDLPAPAHT
ncbi:MAG TPA: GAF domain-containing protein [Kofleriaceae bacterium]|nr:GAF domain-containing protein [Kofleriaceae bacterium]